MNHECSRQIFDKIQVSNFTKILPVGAELFHADRQDGQTDRHDAANSPTRIKMLQNRNQLRLP